MAAQDAAGDPRLHTSDADYLAGLADLAQPEPAAAAHRPEPHPADRTRAGRTRPTTHAHIPATSSSPGSYDPVRLPAARSRTPTATSSQRPSSAVRAVRLRSSRTRTPTTRAQQHYAPAPQPQHQPHAPAAAGRARRDQPLRHQHDRPGPAARLRAGPRAAPPQARAPYPAGPRDERAGLGLWRPVQYPGSSVARTSAIQAARFAQRSRWQPLHDLESRKSPEHAPRPPQSPRVRHTRAGAASRCAPAALPHRGGPQGPRDPRGHRTCREGTARGLELRLESVMEGVLVTGTARASAEGECVRCLEPLQQDVEADFQEMFSYPDADDRGRRKAEPRTTMPRTTRT